MNQVPDRRDVPQKLFATGLYDLKSHDGQGAFVDACVSTLHGIDTNWRHLKKSKGQTAVHGHGEDAVLYLFNDGTALVVDFIGGAGGPDPKPAWGVGTHVYKHSDAAEPDEHGFGAVAPAPVASKVLPKQQAYDLLVELNTFYQAPDGLQRPGGLVRPDKDGRMVADMEAIAQWFYQLVIEGVSIASVKDQIRQSDEWQSKH